MIYLSRSTKRTNGPFNGERGVGIDGHERQHAESVAFAGTAYSIREAGEAVRYLRKDVELYILSCRVEVPPDRRRR